MRKVFVSYRHVDPDERLAKAISEHLEKRGCDVFLDVKIRLGLRWVEEIERQILLSQFFVVLLSKDSIRSDMVRKEVELAHRLETEGKLKILPVRVGFEGGLPYDLGAYLDAIQYTFWTPSEPSKPILQQIHRAISESAPLPQSPPDSDSGEPVKSGDATDDAGAPLPVADPRMETGTVNPQSPYYVRRPTDGSLEKLMAQQGETAVIRAPRQYGKSSLLAQAHARQRENGQSCYIDFQHIGENQLAGLDELCKYLALKISQAFRTRLKPSEVWDSGLGPKESLRTFIADAVLLEAKSPVLFCLDELDRIFDKPYREDFYLAVRGWHNDRAIEDCWTRLNLLIAHSTEPTLWIQNINVSPFNVGVRLRLEPFGEKEVSWLNARYGAPLKSRAEIQDLLKLLGGQPYLTRQALYSMRVHGGSMEDLKKVAAHETQGPFGDHLRRHLWVLHKNDRRKKALLQILRDGSCDEEIDFEKLLAGGLIRGETRQTARAGCELYAEYFRMHL